MWAPKYSRGEFASMTIDERKAAAEIAVAEARPFDGSVMISVSDQDIEVAAELARHAESIGAHLIVAHSPLLYFGAHTDDTIVEYYRYLAAQVDIGVALWNQPPDCGYELTPELCLRMAREIPNVVAIKYSVERQTYARLTHLAGKELIVSSSNERWWLDNIIELGWQVYLCSTPPLLMQTATDRRMHDYTEAALGGDVAEARRISASLDPVRAALAETRPAGKAAAHQKYWQELLGQVGGRVRRPYLELTEAERAATGAAFDRCGLT
ncbi:MAG: dihydrodipicolinate synthase family protein [Actinomycetota bacterium]